MTLETYNVTGINIDKAAKIAYRLESVYLSANSTMLMPELMVFNQQLTYTELDLLKL
jgi:hypothetical protein